MRMQQPTPEDVIRYRYHHGCNLGSVFVLERWLTPSAFPSDVTESQSSELEAVKLSAEADGIEATRMKFEQRWSSALTDIDLDWLVNVARCKYLHPHCSLHLI